MDIDFDIDSFDDTIPHTDAEYEAFIAQARIEIDRMRAKMREDQIIIDRNHAEFERSKKKPTLYLTEWKRRAVDKGA